MDNTQRQETFGKLREPCVELSSIGLKFRGNQATAAEVFRAVEPLHKILKQLATKNALDEKLAEYAFFPLTHIFNDTKRLSARCLESAVNCLQILVADGWQQRLSPALGKQLIILLTLIVGGSPNQGDGKEPLKPEASEELAIAGFGCLRTIFNVLEGPVAEQTIFHEIGTATVVDQTVYILVEGLVDEKSDEVCLAAAKALQALYARITDRVVLASIMPRTVSALTKVLKPTTQVRRSYKLLQTCLDIFTELVRAVLNDCVATATKKVASIPPEDDKLVLDDSWLKATTTQIKLALANVIQVRRHERPEVQAALLNLCLMVIEECQATLDDAISLMVQTVVVLADQEDQSPNKAFTTLVHLATVYPPVLESLKESLHTWLTSFPRIMHSNDETAKQWGVRQISTAFQVLSQVQSGSHLLTGSLASGLCDSVGAAIKSNSALQPLASPGDLNLEVLQLGGETRSFPPVLMAHTSQQQTLKDLRSMIIRLNSSGSGNDITRSIVNRVHALSDESIIAPFWLSLTFLSDNSHFSAGFDDFVSLDHVEQPLSLSTRSSMIEELYYISLTILNEQSAVTSQDWRISALALEAIALQAQRLGEAFRPELMDALYPTLQLLTSSNSNLQWHAMTCLNVLMTACNYADTSSMIIENVDYLVNSVALKLNTFDVSPYPPQVLFMMVKLCGGRLVPYLDDLVDSIFGILDLYHGYPRLVETMFKTLGSIVEEGAKKQSLLTIDDGKDNSPYNHRKSLYQRLSTSTIAKDIADRKAKRAKHAEEELADSEGEVSHPKQPWSETYKQAPKEPESVEELLQQAESDEPLPPPKEPEDSEKPLSKTHNLLLHIVKSIPSHLSSPSPYLRRSLLSMLIDVLPVLAQNENSFLPLINDLWNSVATRIIFPSPLTNDSSKSLIPRTSATDLTSQPGQHDFQEETFVITAACSAIEAMAKGAGDFMASRIEPEFPRWERLFKRVWEKVRQDAEAANERRARYQKQQQRSGTQPSSAETNLELSMALLSSLSLTPASASGGTTGPRVFTSHHTVWRALLSLFLTVLAYVRLPVAVGDQICEFVVSWIVLFAGADYYFNSTRRGRQTDGSEDPLLLQSVEGAIQTMEAWNADLTWFLFVQHRCKQRGDGTTRDPVSVGSGESHRVSVEVFGELLSFAVAVF